MSKMAWMMVEYFRDDDEACSAVDSRRSMRLVPIVRRARVDLQRQRQHDGGERSILHGVLHDRQRRSDLVVGYLEDQLVMHLQQHLRRELLFGQRILHPDHGAADDIGCAALEPSV